MESKHVPAIYCRNLIAQLCEEESIEPRRFFAGTTINASHLGNDSDTTTHSNQIKVYERVAALSTRPGFGFRAGAKNQFGDQGLLGALLYTAPSVAVAFTKLEQYIDVIGGMLRYHVSHGGSRLFLTCTINGLVSEAAQRLITEESIAIWNCLALPVGGLQQLTQQIRVDYPRPPHAHLYEEAIPEVEFQFGRPKLQIVLSRDVLDVPMPGSNPPTFELLESQCAAILERISPSLTQKIEQYLQDVPPARWTESAVTEHLHCSSRTLRRWLGEDGTSLRAILDRHRADVARRAFLRGDSVAQVADACGFAGADGFSRAFKRWTGLTPGAYVAQLSR